jgi:hypothetical protein
MTPQFAEEELPNVRLSDASIVFTKSSATPGPKFFATIVNVT